MKQQYWADVVRAHLIKMRETRGFSLRELATFMTDHNVETTDRTLRRIEDGEVEPRSEYVDAWQKACGVFLRVEAEDRWKKR